MSILFDPEHNEPRAIFGLVPDWKDKSVLEVGSGDGRLTWRYAEKAARVVAIEPDAEMHKIALENRPQGMGHVEFVNLGLDEFFQHVTQSAPVPQAQVSEANSLKQLSSETLQSPGGSFRVTRGEKFDLAILSWSL